MSFFEKIIDMTSVNELMTEPFYLLMILISIFLLYLGIAKKYEPLLLVPIGFGILISNIPGSNLGVVKVDESLGLLEIAQNYGIINFLYYALIKTGFLPPLIFMGVGALTDFGPMLKNLRLVFFGAAAQIGIFSVLIIASLIGFSNQEAASLAIIGGADGPTAIYTSIVLASPVDDLKLFFNTELSFIQSSYNKLDKNYDISEGTFVRNSDNSVRVDVKSPFKEIYFLNKEGLEIHDLEFDQVKNIPIDEIDNFLVNFIINGDIDNSKINNLNENSFSIIEDNSKFYFEFLDQNTLQIKFKDNMEVNNLIKFTKK